MSYLGYARAMRQRIPQSGKVFGAGDIDFRLFQTLVYRRHGMRRRPSHGRSAARARWALWPREQPVGMPVRPILLPRRRESSWARGRPHDRQPVGGRRIVRDIR